MESKKRTILQAVFCTVLVCLIWGGYFFIKTYHADRILDIKEDDFSWVYQVDSVTTDEKKVVLKGFAFQIGKDAEKGHYEVILQDIESGEKYFPEMEYHEREDVNEYFSCEQDYLVSGFIAAFEKENMSLEENNFEVLLRIVGKKTAYQTGTFVSEGELMYTDPRKFNSLDVVGTELKDVIEKGILRVYRSDYGAYVYQYKDELYWFFERDYNLGTEGNAYIPCSVSTTQVSKLPQHRLELGLDYDDVGFQFRTQELKGGGNVKYYVAKKSLPREYSVSKLWTGEYIDGWTWIQYFRPYYDFN